jgi:IS30 family transposase
MSERFERHRQPWRQDEIQKLHQLAGKGMSVRAIAKALTRSEEPVTARAQLDRVKIAKLRSSAWRVRPPAPPPAP